MVALRFGTCPPVLISVITFTALMSSTATLFAPASEMYANFPSGVSVIQFGECPTLAWPSSLRSGIE